MNNHLMVDIETMSTRHDAAIASIGAVVFNPNDEPGAVIDQYYQTIHLESCERFGRHFSAGTIAWWLATQDQTAQKSLFRDQLPLNTALGQLLVWIHKHRCPNVWANSPSFDCLILRNAFAAVQLEFPFKYWQERDVRTIKDCAFPNGDAPQNPPTVAHNALDDAISQAELVQACFSVIRRAHHSTT